MLLVFVAGARAGAAHDVGVVVAAAVAADAYGACVLQLLLLPLRVC